MDISDFQRALKANEYLIAANEKTNSNWVRYFCCFWVWRSPSWQNDEATSLTLKAAHIFVLLKDCMYFRNSNEG